MVNYNIITGIIPIIIITNVGEKTDWNHFPIVMLMVVIRTRKRLVIGNKTNATTIIQNIIEKEKNIPNRYWYLNPHEVRVSRLKFYWIYTCTSWHRLGGIDFDFTYTPFACSPADKSTRFALCVFFDHSKLTCERNEINIFYLFCIFFSNSTNRDILSNRV